MGPCEGAGVPAPGDRLALRRAGGRMPGGDPWPQVGTQAGLKPGDGLKIGPDSALQDRRNGGVVDARERFGGSKTATVHGLEDVEGQDPGRLDVGSSAGTFRPVLHEVCRELANGAAHAESLGNVDDSRVSSSREVAKETSGSASYGHTVGSNHQSAGDAVARAIAEYRPDIPDEAWAIIGPFVREAVTDCGTETPYTAQQLLATSARHVWWCWRSAGLGELLLWLNG